MLIIESAIAKAWHDFIVLVILHARSHLDVVTAATAAILIVAVAVAVAVALVSIVVVAVTVTV